MSVDPTYLSSPEETAASHAIDAAWSHVSHDAKMRLAKFQRMYSVRLGRCSRWTEDLAWACDDEEWAMALMVVRLQGEGGLR